MLEKLADVVALAIKTAVAPLAARLDALERRPLTPGPAGPSGERGAPGVDGKDGAPGPAGRDGTLEQLVCEHDGERTITLRSKDGRPVEGGVITFPIVLDRGSFTSGRTDEKGDGVSYGGSFWIAQTATESRPDATASGWRLAVKRGDIGKPGRDASEARAGAPVVTRGR